MAPAEDSLAEIFPGDSEMARLMRQWDWAGTPLGPPEAWPEALKIPLKMLLTSRFEMWLGWGPELCFFYNDAYIPTLGLKHPRMLGKPFREVWAEVYDDVADQVDRVRAGEATWNKALLLLLERNGYPEETYHSFSYSPLYGAAGSVEGLFCTVSEETERVINERRMDMLRQLGMALVGAADQSAVVEAVCSVLNLNRRDFPFALLYLPNEAKACSPDSDHLIGRAWPFERSVSDELFTFELTPDPIYPTGAWKRPPTQALIVPIPGAGGEITSGAMVFGLNPHRRNDVQVMDVARLVAGQIGGALANVGALQSERRRADRIWSNSRDLMVVIGADGVYKSVSPAWTRILGHRIDQVVGHHQNEFVLPDDVPSSADALDRALHNRDLTAFENRLVGSDGEIRWISWHTSTEQDLVYGYGRDVTEEKENAAALAAAEDALRQSQKMEAVGQLTGGIAHDFNNLLTGIVGSLEMMKRRSSEGRPADVERYASMASSAAHRASSLTQRLLAFSRRQPLDPKTVGVNELVEDMVELIRRSIGESISLEMNAAPDLWYAKCDANQLESALLNLAINARDAMPHGGRLTISTGNAFVSGKTGRSRIVRPGDFVVIAVTDTGVGMTPDVKEKAFEPFFTTKPIGQGTGLGLSMIYGFIQQSGGFVDIDSEEGRGTTVRLYLPRSEAPRPSIDGSAAAPAINRNDLVGTVLVVEDEAAVRAIVVDALRDSGYRTIEAGESVTGLKHLESSDRIDILVTDVGLPGGLNGRQLADAARVLRPNLKVLFMTAYAHNTRIGTEALEPGMELIAKPFVVDALIERVNGMIEANRRLDPTS